MTSDSHNTWIETRTGRRIDFMRPDPGQIHILDIAYGLARIPRFCGQTLSAEPYSVAQHSCWVADRVTELGGTAAEQLRALLHDAHEAYMGNIPTPLKAALNGALLPIQQILDSAISMALHLPQWSANAVRLIDRADHEALALEALLLTPNGGTWPGLAPVDLQRTILPDAAWPQARAVTVWLAHYRRLAGLANDPAEAQS